MMPFSTDFEYFIETSSNLRTAPSRTGNFEPVTSMTIIVHRLIMMGSIISTFYMFAYIETYIKGEKYKIFLHIPSF